MKKYLLIALCAVHVIAHASESDKTIMCLAGTTLFLVTKDTMPNYHGVLDVMAVGKREQDRLKKSVEENNAIDNVIGTAFCVKDKTVYVLPKTSQSSSNDDNYNAFSRDYKLYKKAEKQEVKSDLMHVIEPVIVFKDLGKHRPQAYSYSPYRAGAENPYTITCHNFLGDTALDEIRKDLELCYQNALVKGLELIKNKGNKSIGLNALGKWIPKHIEISATFKAITNFLACNNGYTFVQLFVRKHSELHMYKKLMLEYNERNKK